MSVEPITFTGIGELTEAYVRSMIPSTSCAVIITGYTSIGQYAFLNQHLVISVEIGNSVENINNAAFAECISMTDVYIPNSVTFIATGAFSNCISLTKAIIPKYVTRIGNNAFINCPSLITVVIQDVTKIIEISPDSFTDVRTNIDSIITFENLASYNMLSPVWKIISQYYHIQKYGTFIIFPDINVTYGDVPQQMFYQSNSNGSVTFTSSNELVATVNGSIIEFVGAGTCDITLLQEATTNYLEGTSLSLCTVLENNPENFVQIGSSSGLVYYLSETTAVYANLNDSINVTAPLIANGEKVLTTDANVTIIKNTEPT